MRIFLLRIAGDAVRAMASPVDAGVLNRSLFLGIWNVHAARVRLMVGSTKELASLPVAYAAGEEILCGGAAGRGLIGSPVKLARNMERIGEVGLLHAEQLLSIDGIFSEHIYVLLQLNTSEPFPDLVVQNKWPRQRAQGNSVTTYKTKDSFVSARKAHFVSVLRHFQSPPITCAIDQARTTLYPIRLESRNRSTASLFCIARPVMVPEGPCLEPGRVAEPCSDISARIK